MSIDRIRSGRTNWPIWSVVTFPITWNLIKYSYYLILLFHFLIVFRKNLSVLSARNHMIANKFQNVFHGKMRHRDNLLFYLFFKYWVEETKNKHGKIHWMNMHTNFILIKFAFFPLFSLAIHSLSFYYIYSTLLKLRDKSYEMKSDNITIKSACKCVNHSFWWASIAKMK